MDTVTLLRSGIRGLLAAAGGAGGRLRALLRRDDDYAECGQAGLRLGRRGRARGARRRARPGCHGAARRARGRGPRRRPLAQAAALLATLVGQDLETDAGRRLPHRPAGGPGPGHLDGRSRGPPRPQDRRPRLRRLQGPRRARPRHRARHRDRGDARQRRRRRVAPELLADDLPREPDAAPDRLRRRRLWQRRAARDPRGRRGDHPGQGPAAGRPGGRFSKDDFTIDLARAR